MEDKSKSISSIVITGADGFVGSNTVNKFLNEGVKVIAIDLPEEPRRLIKSPNLKYYSCDISNASKMRKILSENHADAFLHFAWKGSAGAERTDYNLQIQNALTTVECLNMAKEAGAKRFICAGSIMEYEIEFAIHAQGSKPGMGYIYGMGKHIAHSLCKSIAANIGIDLIWPMITNAYGVGELSPRFINTTLRKIINHEPLQFTAATQNYDFVYVTDVAKALYLVAQFGKPFSEYIIGSGEAGPLKGFILEMTKACGAETAPLFGDIPFTGTNLPLSTFSIEDLQTDCGFSPEVSFAEGTRKTMEWLKTQ
ncbi:MAG: NAD-dependent epimerase/dehydratase family protein [Bacteroidales bacterium]|nr:NAD-dependent epimerase/dehydratase family protein [Bacteroidales bacterium]